MLHGSKVEQAALLAEVDEDIEIAVRTCVPAGDGAEDPYRVSAMA